MTLSVRNIGGTATSGAITVTDTLPAGLTYVQATGNGWDCSGSTPGQVLCVRNAVLNAGATAPLITVTLSVAGDAASVLQNTAVATTPGDVDTAQGTSTALCRRNPVPAPAASASTLVIAVLLLSGIAWLALQRLFAGRRRRG
jgi:hypothetical protein